MSQRISDSQDIDGAGRGRIEGAGHEDAANGVLVVQVRCFRAISAEISELAAREADLAFCFDAFS
jgi:hypothetical protein